MCAHKMSKQLYDNLKQVCENHVQKNLEPFLEYRESCHTMFYLEMLMTSFVALLFRTSIESVQFLKMLDQCWQAHCRQMVCIVHALHFRALEMD